jgi:predicted ester cyclase
MSREENKKIARRVVEDVWGKGDFAAEQELIAINVVDHNPLPGLAPGLEGHHQALAMFRSAFDGQMTLEDVIAEGDKVVDRWTFHGTHRGAFFGIPPTGKQVTLTGMDFSRIENGQIVEFWHQEDILGLMQQLGVAPAPEQTNQSPQ